MADEIEIEFEDARTGVKFRLKGPPSVVDKYLEEYGYKSAISDAATRSTEKATPQQLNQSKSMGEIPEKPQKAETLSQYVLELLHGEWGVNGRTSTEIISVAQAHGIAVPMSTLSSILNALTRNGRIRRLKVPGDKKWHYYASTAHSLSKP